MDDADDIMRQDAAETKQKMDAEAAKHRKPGQELSDEDEDTGLHTTPERDIGSQRKATSSSRTPSNEI